MIAEFMDDAQTGETMDRLFVNGTTRTWIQKASTIYGGKPCIRDTRVLVHDVVKWKKQGLGDKEILSRTAGLSQEDLEAAWEYYAQNGDEIDELIAKQT